MANEARYTFSYRSNEAYQVMEWVRAGQCGSIVGLRGVGKSNFLHFLLRKDVQTHYLGQESDAFYFSFVDFLALVERSEWGIYELILNSIARGLPPLNWDRKIIDEISIQHQAIIRSRDALVARRAFEYCVALMSQQYTRRLVFLFDEFEVVFRDPSVAMFKHLRAIRDAYKDQISLVVVSAHDFSDLGFDLVGEVDHFYRLISRNICWLGPYQEKEAREMIGYLAARRSRILSETDMERLIELSGGHGGLLKAILSLVWNPGNQIRLVQALQIANEPSVRRECDKIWESLSDSEKSDLTSLSKGEQLVTPERLSHLRSRGLVLNSEEIPMFFSPLFGSYVKRQVPPPTQGIYVNRSMRAVHINGKHIENLTELEFEILCYLYESRGHLCTKDDIIKSVYRQQYDHFEGGVTDEAIQALISRLREKIEPDRHHPRYVVTVRGQGYRFVDQNDTDVHYTYANRANTEMHRKMQEPSR